MLLLVRVGRWELSLHNERDDDTPAEQIADMPQPMQVYAEPVGFRVLEGDE